MKKIKNEYIEILIKMSLPILMNYIVMTLFEIIDKAIVGNYSTEGFAAIGVSASFIFVITGAFGVLSTAYNIIAAKAVGEKNQDTFDQTFNIVMIISIIVGILIILAAFIGGKYLFSRVYGLDGVILSLALDYFYIGSVTVMLNMIIFNFSVYFRNLKDTRVSFYSTVISTTINVIFDYILVYGKFGFKELGVKGAAVGSVLGLISGIVVYLIKFKNKKAIKTNLKGSLQIAKQLIKLYIPLLAQDIVEGTIFTIILASIVARLGVYQMAAYNLSETVIGAVGLPVFALSSSAVTLSLQKSFANDKREAIRIINTAVVISILIVLSAGTIVMIFPDNIMSLITKDKVVVEAAIKILIIGLFAKVFNIFSVVYKSYLQGINGEGFVFKCTSIVSFLSIFWIIILAINFSLAGVYIGIMINNFIFASVYYLKIRYSYDAG